MHETATLDIALNERSTAAPSASILTFERDWTSSRQSFERVYRSHVGRIYAICMRMTADQSRAEELTQEVFVRAWEKRATFRGEHGLFPWLRRIAINAVLSDVRTRSRLTELDGEHGAAIRLASTSAEPTTPMALERAIAGLPSGARVVLLLHDVEGHTHGEIGQMLDVSPTTSKTQLHRARKLLRKALS